MQEDLLASLGSWSWRCWSLATHVAGTAAGSSSSSSQEQWAARPQGPLLWFHALTLGETAVVLPVVFRCLLEYNEHVHVLLTTKSSEAVSLLSSSLPARVIVQDVPLDSHISMGRFLAHFQPQACILMESPACPVLVEACAGSSIRLGLLNARMSSRAFLSWFQGRVSRALLRRMLVSFSLIVPQSDIDVGRFRIFGATLSQMPGWCSDLKYAAALGNSVWHLWRPKPSRIASLRAALCGRPLWVAAHTQPGEEEAVATVHGQMAKDWPSLLTVLSPAASGRCNEVAEMLASEHSLRVLLWSAVVDAIAPQAHKQQQQQPSYTSSSSSSSWLPSSWRSKNNGSGSSSSDSSADRQQQLAAATAGHSSSSSAVDPAMLLKGVDVLLLDLQADLPLMYSVSEVAFIGSSLLEGCSGHNLAEAAVAGCAVLVGEHAGHFSTMADELNQAAMVAAEEASAAVNSSGPMEDPFFAAADSSSTAAAPATAAASTSGAGGASSSAGAAAAGGGGGGPASEHAVMVEGAESEEPSPRDGSHWRGVLHYAQYDDEQQQQYADASGGGSSSRDGYSNAYYLQQQQQQQLQQLLEQQPSSSSSLRPSTAPAAVSSLGGAGSSSSSLAGLAPGGGGSRAAAAADGSSSGGGAFGAPAGVRNTAALLYRRHARTGSSNNSSRVSSPVASQRPSTAGGASAGQQQQQQDSYMQQQHRSQRPSPLQVSSGGLEQQPEPPQQQPPEAAAAAAGQHARSRPCAHSSSTSGGGGSSANGSCRECGASAQHCPAVDRQVPQAPPPSAATNTPVNGPTGNVTPVTPAGSFGGADPALLQQPDSRVLAQRLAQQQQQVVGGQQHPRNSDPAASSGGGAGTRGGADTHSTAANGSSKQQQQAHGNGSSSSQPPLPQHYHQQQQQQQQQQQLPDELRLQHLGNSSSSSGGGGASGSGSGGGTASSNGASTPLSGVADLYSLPHFPTSPKRMGGVLPQTPHPTPEDSAHTMGGRSPMTSGAGVPYSQDLATLALQHPADLLLQQQQHEAPSAEPSWQSASSSTGGCAGHEPSAPPAAAAAGTAAAAAHLQQQRSDAGGGSSGGGSAGDADSSSSSSQRLNASLLQRPACPSPPDAAPCFSRSSAVSSVGSMPQFTSSHDSHYSTSSGGSGGSSGSNAGEPRSSSRLGRTVSSGGWQEEQQRQRHRQHLQGIVGGVWRGGSEGGSPMVAAIAEAAAAADSGSDDDDSGDERQEQQQHKRGGRRQYGAQSPHAAADTACGVGVDGGSDPVAVSLNGGLLSAESSGLFGDQAGSDTGSGGGCECGGCAAGADSSAAAADQEDDAMPFSRSPTFAELAACNRDSSSGGCQQQQQCGSNAGGSKVVAQLGSTAGTVSAGAAGVAAAADRQNGVVVAAGNGCSLARSSSSSQGEVELYVPDLCPAEAQQQQQQQRQQQLQHARLLSDQGSVGWEDWGQQQQQRTEDEDEEEHCANGTAVAAAAAAAGAAHGSDASAGGGRSEQQAHAAAVRVSDGGAAGLSGSSRLGDPRRSRHFLDLPSDTSSVTGEEVGEIQPAQQQQHQQQLPPPHHHQQQHHQQLPPHLLPHSGAGSAASGTAGGWGAYHSSSSGGGGTGSAGGGGVWGEHHHHNHHHNNGGHATPPSWGATPRSTPHQQHSAATTPSAGVTPRSRGGHQRATSGSSQQQHYAGYQAQYQQYQQQQQQAGRRSADLQYPYAHVQQHHHQHQQHYQHHSNHLADGSSGGGGSAGMFSPLARLVGGGGDAGSYRRAESVTSMTSFATSAGGDRDMLLHDDFQPGSSRMSLLGETSSHLGFSTAGGGRFSGFTGMASGAFPSTGRFSECATPRSAVTDVFRGGGHHSEQQVLPGGVEADAGNGLLTPGTSYLRYRGDYILPATHLPSSPQGPAVWRVSGVSGLTLALSNLLQEPLERRSRGHAAAQAAAKLASGLVSTVWHVVDDMVVTPALQDFVAQGGLAGDAAAQHAARAPRIPGHPRI